MTRKSATKHLHFTECHERAESKVKDFAEGKKIIILLVFFIILLIAVGTAMTCGAYNISVSDVFSTVIAHLTPFLDISEISKLNNTIIWNIRFPRILLSITVGVALATAGTVFQGCFRNPLVEPYILGVSAGAAFGAALGIVFPTYFLSILVLAFIFGSMAVAGAWFMARMRGETPVVTLILSGVIIGSVFSSLVGIMKYIAQDAALREIVFWLMGGFYYTTWKDVTLISPIVATCFLIICFLGWKLNILSMGDEEARALGVNPEKYKLILIFLATLITAISVSA
ncbi:iron ABC transporter permease, partial [bacterium]|nr:iron ABC transporter permease [bacterium]